MCKIKIFSILFFALTISFASELTKDQQQIVQNRLLHEFAQTIWTQAMEAKQAFQNTNNLREDPISGFATTAPRTDFIVNADISSELQAGTESATVHVSTDGQSTWYSAPASLLGTPGYENTYEGTIATPGGTSAYSYISGLVASEALGYDYGTIIVSGSPHNVDGAFPPSPNLYAHFVDEPSGDASSNQDITALRGTYRGSLAVDGEGNEFTDVERIYLSLTLDGSCCDGGGLFGPWYLYGVGIVNPEAEEAVAYAIGYGDGGFGQLTPGLLKITGDLSTGEIDGFDYLPTTGSTFEHSLTGSDMHATVKMSDMTDDSQWGVWPNSFNGFIVLGVTVSADISESVTIHDQTNPGLMICNTVYQDGNLDPVLSNYSYDSDTMELSVTYADADGNLPWFHSAQVCEPDGGPCFLNVNMIPDSHNYSEGVIFTASLTEESLGDDALDPGEYWIHFWFMDDFQASPEDHLTIEVGGCDLMGDANGDNTLNVLDVVLLVNVILSNGDTPPCADINGDGSLNVLDIVLMVNIILAPDR